MFTLLQEFLHGTAFSETMKQNLETVSMMENIAHYSLEIQDIMGKTLFMKIWGRNAFIINFRKKVSNNCFKLVHYGIKISTFSLLSIEREQDWWTYVHDVHRNCRLDITKDCSRNSMNKIGIDFDEIFECVNESFDNQDHTISDNRILAKEFEDRSKNGPHFFPAMIINNITYRGFLTPDNVFQAICEGFKKHPEECKSIEDSQAHIVKGINTKV